MLPMPELVSLGDRSFVLPEGWRQVDSTANSMVLRSADDRQQMTVDIIFLREEAASLDNFKKICAVRLKAEKERLLDGSTEANPSVFTAHGTFGMVFSGADRKTHRLFSTYLLLQGQQLLTIYVEGFAIPVTRHMETFKGVISTLRRS
jgi:hypothetical protein